MATTAAVVGGLGAAAGGILPSVLGGGGQKPKNLVQNPLAGLLANLFGVGTKFSGRGGILLGKRSDETGTVGPFKGGVFANRVFVPEDFDALRGILEPIPLSGLELLSNEIAASAGESFPVAQAAIADALNTTLGISREGVPFEPIRQQALRTFDDQTTDFAERFAGTTGTFSEPFIHTTAEERRRFFDDLAATEARFEQGNRQLQLQAGTQTGLLGSALTQLPLDVASGLFGAGQRFRTAQESVLPSTRLLDVISTLGNLSSGLGFTSFQANANPFGSNVANTLNAFATGLPQVVGALGNIFGGGGGGGLIPAPGITVPAGAGAPIFNSGILSP